MKRRLPVLASAAAAAGLLLSSGTAYAHTVFDTGMVTVHAETRAVKLDVDGVTVALNKVSDPGVQVRVTTGEGSESASTMTRHAAGENGCSAADDLGKGTLNRTIVVRDGAWATVYVKVQYTTTTPIGASWVTVVEPLGPVGVTVTGLGLVDGVPVSICVA